MGKEAGSAGAGWALVTGASSGIGAAVAKELWRRGYRVVGTSRAGGRTAEWIERWIRVDLSDAEAVSRMEEEEGELLGRLAVLVNCAGMAEFGDLGWRGGAKMGAELELLLGTPMRLTAAVLGGMRERGDGWIIQVSSLAAVFPLPYLAVYSAAKAGLSQFGASLEVSEGAGGIRYLDVQAGDFRTAFNDRLGSGGGSERERRVRGQLERWLGAGPEPEVAARSIGAALERGRGGRIRVGGFFQCRLAPLGARLLPHRWLLALVRRYYGLGWR